MIDEVLPFVEEIVGSDMVLEDEPMTGTEDFGYVSNLVPSAYFLVGAGGPDAYPHHNPNFVLDESTFVTGASLYANCAMEWLEKKYM